MGVTPNHDGLREAGVTPMLLSALEMVQEGILLIDAEGLVKYANQAYGKILGVPPARIVGKNLHDIEPGTGLLQVLKDGKERLQHCETIPSLDVEIVSNLIPLHSGDKLIGAIAVFCSAETSIYFQEALMRSKSYSAYLETELARRHNVPPCFSGLIGKNSLFLAALRLASKAAETDVSVFIRGETGVGKDLLAEAIHRASARRNGPMVRMNCAAVPETLLESELFGYEDGAFTGARKGGQAGKFEMAHQGTLFLDEVGTMSLEMQAKLLLVLERREVQRVGGSTTRKLNVRLVAATNADLEATVKQGTFRLDLYYRLHIFPILLPPLRERRDDILILADTYLKRFGQKYGRELKLSREVVAMLLDHPWPGNIRELVNVMEYAVIACEGDSILPRHLPAQMRRIDYSEPDLGDFRRHLSGSMNLQEIIARFELAVIRQVLEETGNNRSEAMRLLGLSRPAFYQKLHKHGMNMRSSDLEDRSRSRQH